MKTTSLKVMILGLSLMLAGIYIQNEPGLTLGTSGWEIIIIILGFVLVIGGLLTKE